MNLFLFTLVVSIAQLQFLVIYAEQENPESDCFLTTNLGLIQGRVENSRNDKRYCSFMGIPYAGKTKRFEEAKLKNHWRGTLNATVPGSKCPQIVDNTKIYDGDEDCLFLNIFYPIDDQCEGFKRLPVIVFIHGGEFKYGSGAEYGPKYIMNRCTVFVTINHRLSALGFLTTNDGLIPGNLGLKDIVLSLKWVQKHIKNFGGNPKSVTIIGFSCGASAVIDLIVSPTTKGLFHRAIAQSSPSINPQLLRKNPTKHARELAKRLKCGIDSSSSTADIKKCLLAAPAKDIVENQNLPEWANDPITPFAPVVENTNASRPFLTVNPLFKLLAGDFQKVPLLISFAEDEGAMYEAFALVAQPHLASDLNTKWEEIAPINLSYDEDYIPQEEKNTFSKKIRSRYFGEKNISMETMQNLINLHTDRFFTQSIFDTAELYSRYAPFYGYVFAYKKGNCPLCTLGFPYPVATHTTEMMHIYNLPEAPLYPEIVKNTPAADFSDRHINFLLSFAKTGVPSETWPEKNLMKRYESTEGKNYNWYKIDEEISEVPNYLKDRREFWRNLGLRKYDFPAFY